MSSGERSIELTGVRQNNLKNLDIKIPLGRFTVVCGPSGSGKSSLAFETLYAEGQRRYIESLSSYARQFVGKAPKPDLDSIRNVPPSIAIEQKNPVKTSRSTVGTLTEVVDYLRLLFEKLGRTHCPTNGFAIQRDTVHDATTRILSELTGARGYILAPVDRADCPMAGADLFRALIENGLTRLWVESEDVKWEQLEPKKSTRGGKASAKVSAGTSSKGAARKLSTRASASQAQPQSSHWLTNSEPPCRRPDERRSAGQMLELDPSAAAPALPEGSFWIIIDRLSFRDDERARISEAVQLAYLTSLKFSRSRTGGRCQVTTIDARTLVFSEDTSCSLCGHVFAPVTSQLFSFSSPMGACPACNGFGNVLALDEAKVIPNPELSLGEGAIQPLTMPSAATDRRQLMTFCKAEGISTKTPWQLLSQADRDRVWKGQGKWYGVVGLFDYLETKKYKMHVRVFLSRYKSGRTCTTCGGSRLRPDVKNVRLAGATFTELCALPLKDLANRVADLPLRDSERELAKDVLEQLESRLRFLLNVGVEYLTLDRPAKTLSGGEYQRLMLAKQLGMGLSQTLYVLDEPTVGLHPRDNDRLIQILQGLRDLGNTLVVVEHDPDVIQASETVVEMGPGSGPHGGQVVFEGPTEKFLGSTSPTAGYLKPGRRLDAFSRNRPIQKSSLKHRVELSGCSGHNLQSVDLTIPLNRLVVVTGVSGSGKSSLITQTLYPAVAQKLRVEYVPCLPFSEIKGVDGLSSVLMIDQSPSATTARSNPVTYLKVYDEIRSLFAATPEAKARGYTPGTFSLNVDGGRCPVCKGLGYEIIDMLFMDDVLVPCDACDTKRFRSEVLEIKFRDKSISDVLDMTGTEALQFFVQHPHIRHSLMHLKSVGLEYLKLGQPTGTLSGGESQRLRLARELALGQPRGCLYILDEPTTGLHFKEIELLLLVLQKLVDSGASLVVVEHNLDIIANADHVIDLGPEAGVAGGRIVFEGRPSDLARSGSGLTARYLAKAWGNGLP